MIPLLPVRAFAYFFGAWPANDQLSEIKKFKLKRAAAKKAGWPHYKLFFILF